MKKVLVAIFIAFLLWCLMFSPWTAPHLSFWACMTTAAVILIGISLCLLPDFKAQWHFSPKEIAIGIASAAILWGIFWIGDKLSSMMFAFAKPEVNAIYGLKGNGNPWLIGAALLLVIGPAEEIFWRGTVLRAFLGRFRWPLAVMLAAAIYSLVHILSLNFMLVMAALACGIFWSVLYAWRRDLAAVTISHCLWDVAVFLIFPI